MTASTSSTTTRPAPAAVTHLAHYGHRRVAFDVAVIGYGDFPMAEALAPAITVVDQDPGALGRIAVERLIQRIKVPDAPVRRRTVLPVRLIPRGSGELPPA